jgi:threonine aldolase
MLVLDLRSDTVTRPTPAMREAMFAAPVGDDVFGDDPSVNDLETYAARLFGQEAALFCPSGTMTNQIALNVHTRPGDEVICDGLSHVYLYEGGGLMANSGLSVTLLSGDRGRLSAQQVRAAIKPDDIHAPVSRVVSLENTVNKGGGCYYALETIHEIRAVTREYGLALHLDGARLFNALVETGESPTDYGQRFDSISICLSKGLGCPVGSLLLGDAAFIKRARRVRKRLGGGWRQAGFLAAAGRYALENHVERLREDHQRARVIGGMLEALPEVVGMLPVETNIVIFQLAPELHSGEYVRQLAERGILAAPFGPDKVRFVTHLDFTDEHLDGLASRLKTSILA